MCFLICYLTYVGSQSGDRPFVFRHTVEQHKWALLFLGGIAVVQYMWFQRIYGAYPYCVACPECLNMNSDDSFTECLNAVGCPSTVMNKWTEPGIRMYFCSMPIFFSLSANSAPWHRRMSRSAATSNVGGSFARAWSSASAGDTNGLCDSVVYASLKAFISSLSSPNPFPNSFHDSELSA